MVGRVKSTLEPLLGYKLLSMLTPYITTRGASPRYRYDMPTNICRNVSLPIILILIISHPADRHFRFFPRMRLFLLTFSVILFTYITDKLDLIAYPISERLAIIYPPYRVIRKVPAIGATDFTRPPRTGGPLPLSRIARRSRAR